MRRAMQVAMAAWIVAATRVDAGATQALGLEDALRMAAARNWDLGDARSRVAGAEAHVQTAGGAPNPTLSLLTSHVHWSGGDATSLGNALWQRGYDTVTQLGQEIELGGKRGSRLASSHAGLDAERDRLADTRRAVTAAVTHAYLDAALAEADAGIARQSASYLSAEAKIADARLAAGDISRSDRDQIAIAAQRLELDAARATVTAQSERIALGLLLGRYHPDADLVLADSLAGLAQAADSAAAAASTDTAQAGGDRPDVAAMRAELRRAEAERALARAGQVPDPTLLVEYEHEPPDRPDSYGVGLALSLPVWNRNRGPVREADAECTRARLAVQRAEAQAASDLVAARAAFAEARDRWRDERDDLLPRATAIRKSVSRAYERGGASLLDLLAAQRSDNEVRQATMQAASDVAGAWADLEAAEQTLTRESTQP